MVYEEDPSGALEIGAMADKIGRVAAAGMAAQEKVTRAMAWADLALQVGDREEVFAGMHAIGQAWAAQQERRRSSIEDKLLDAELDQLASGE